MKNTRTYALIIIACCLFSNLNSIAQQVNREVAVSAYIYNFAKNIQWQNEESITEFRFLVIEKEDIIFNELTRLSKTKLLKNKPIKILKSASVGDISSIHLIFISKDSEGRLSTIFDQIEGHNILLVSENYQDKRIIMINLYDTKDGSLLFEINKSNIINQHLTIMQDMILLGGTEIDVAQLYREGQQSLRNLQLEIQKFENNLNHLKEDGIKKAHEIELVRDSLDKQSILIDEQKRILDSQIELLQKREKEIKIQGESILITQNKIGALADELKTHTEELNKGKALLEDQKREIELQEAQIKQQAKVLKESGQTIHRQKNLMFLLIIIILLVVFLVFSIYYALKIKQEHNRELEQKVNERTVELSLLNEQLRVELEERMHAQEEIRILNQTLEDKVAERTAQLADINKELESFSYSISHDLRAPLRAIFGFSQILSNRHKASLNEEGQQYMDYIVQASVRMEHLINDLLDYSRLGRKSVDIHPVLPNKVIDAVYSDFKQRLDDIGAQFIVDKDIPEILGNESLLQQIFINLIGNAITYRRNNVPLEIRIGFEQNAKSVTIKISDNGIGIPKEYWEKIFNIFQRLHSEDKYPGTGIGLATVRKSVSMLNGTIWVESVVDKGTTFFIHLPKSKI